MRKIEATVAEFILPNDAYGDSGNRRLLTNNLPSPLMRTQAQQPLSWKIKSNACKDITIKGHVTTYNDENTTQLLLTKGISLLQPIVGVDLCRG